MAKGTKTKGNGKPSSNPITGYFGRKSHPTAATTTPTQSRATATANDSDISVPSSSPSAPSPAMKRKADTQTIETTTRIATSASTRPSGSATNKAPPTPLSPKENLLHHHSHSISARLSPNLSRKKPRLLSPEPEPEPEPLHYESDLTPANTSDIDLDLDVDEVAASQSDEQDIFYQPQTHKLSLSQSQRKKSDSKTSLGKTQKNLEDAMDVDDNDNPFASVSASTTTSTSGLFTPIDHSILGSSPFSSSIADQEPLTPPSSSPEPEALQLAPFVPMDTATKTRQIIEKIKKDAMERVESSPEPQPADLDEELRMLSDSEDDSDILPSRPILTMKAKEKEKEKEVVTSPVEKKYNLRGPAAHTAASKEVKPIASSSKPKKTYNPLAELLKEKAKADRAGKGMEALSRAERALEAGDDADDEMEDWMGDEDIARKAVEERDEEHESDEMDCDLNIDELGKDAERLFEGTGGAVAKILASDKKGREGGPVKKVGRKLWVRQGGHGDQMDVDCERFDCDFRRAEECVIVRTLKGALEKSNDRLACLLIHSGSLDKVDLGMNANSDVLSCLSHLALLPDSSHPELALATFHYLRNMWTSSSKRPKPYFPFQSMLDLMSKLGADLPSLPFPSSSSYTPTRISKDKKDNSIWRLVELVGAAATARKLRPDDISSILICLTLIALDPSTGGSARTDIKNTIHLVISRAIGEPGTIANGVETRVCSDLLRLLGKDDMSSINRAFVVRLFGSGDGRTMRITRWVSWGVSVGRTENGISENEYRDLPPLEPVLDAITRMGRGVGAVGDTTDYVGMMYDVEVLCAVFSDVSGYVDEEVRENKTGRKVQLWESASKSSEKTLLQMVHEGVEALHGKISDTRGIHLDRSSTKRVLKILAMKIYYQREAALHSRRKKPKNLKAYFHKK